MKHMWHSLVSGNVGQRGKDRGEENVALCRHFVEALHKKVVDLCNSDACIVAKVSSLI
jgi:hypothetical protein